MFSQEYIDALLAEKVELQLELKRLQANNIDLTNNARSLEDRILSLQAQENAVYDYRLATTATPIMAALTGELYNQTNQTVAPAGQDELEGIARMACDAAEKLLAELDLRATLKD